MNKDIKYVIEDYFENQLNENNTNADIINSYLKTNNFKTSFSIKLPDILDETTIENCTPYLIEYKIYEEFKNVFKNNNDAQISLLFNSKSSKINQDRYNKSNIKLSNVKTPSFDFIIQLKHIKFPIEIKCIKQGDDDNLSITDNQDKQGYRYIYIIVSYIIRSLSINILNIQCIDGYNLQKDSTKIQTQLKNMISKTNNHKIGMEDKKK